VVNEEDERKGRADAACAPRSIRLRRACIWGMFASDKPDDDPAIVGGY
jgi:hypothetical protein